MTGKLELLTLIWFNIILRARSRQSKGKVKLLALKINRRHRKSFLATE